MEKRIAKASKVPIIKKKNRDKRKGLLSQVGQFAEADFA